jgi:hypothetical protein
MFCGLVVFESSENAWMTTRIWLKYLRFIIVGLWKPRTERWVFTADGFSSHKCEEAKKVYSTVFDYWRI